MMKAGKLTLLGVLLITASGLYARKPRHTQRSLPARSVQRIAMLASAAESDEREGADAPVPVAGGSNAMPRNTFRIHDLSRRWVEYQLGARLVATDEHSTPSRTDDLFASQLRGTLPIATLVASPSAITVPAWMQLPLSATVGRYVPGCDPAPYRSTGFLGVGAEARRQAYYGMMSSIACHYGLPVGLFDAMIIRESRYDPLVVSPKKAYGLTQLMPDTATGLGVNRFDVEQNLLGGASYLRRQLDRYGQVHLALAAYNAGPGRVRDAVPAIAETRAYVDEILRTWTRLSGFQQSQVVRSLKRPAAAKAIETERSAVVLTF